MVIQDISLIPASYRSISNEGSSGSSNSVDECIRSYERAENRYFEGEIDLLWSLGYNAQSYHDTRSSCLRCLFPMQLGNQQAYSAAKEYALSLFRKSRLSLISNRELQQLFPYFGITIAQVAEDEEQELIKLVEDIRNLACCIEKVPLKYLSPLLIISSADRFLELLQEADVLSREKCLNIKAPRKSCLNERVAVIAETISTTAQQEISIYGGAVLPDELLSLPNLHTIQLDFCRGLKILPNLSAMERLQKLHITQCPVEDLSPISDVRTLTDLEIRGLRNVKVMFTFHSLSRLERLSVQRMALRELPEGIENLTHLRELLLDRTEIESLPTGIGGCRALQKISLPKTVHSLPGEIASLPNLRELEVYSSCTIPDSLAEKVTLIRPSERTGKSHSIFALWSKRSFKGGISLPSSEETSSDSQV